MSIVSFRFVSYRTGRKPPPTISCLVFLPFRSVPFLSVPSRPVPFRFVPFRSFACLVHARTPSFASLRIRTRVSNADLVSWINVSTHEFQPVSSFVRSYLYRPINRDLLRETSENWKHSDGTDDFPDICIRFNDERGYILSFVDRLRLYLLLFRIEKLGSFSGDEQN